jgi:Holliday junction resolvasome RuvABC DNA-binding subunit
VAEQAATPAPADLRRDDLASALGNLGYDRRAIDKVMDAVLENEPDAPFEQHLRAALKRLSRG